MTILALIGRGRWGSNYLKEVAKVEECQIKYIKTHDYADLLNCRDIDGIIIATPAETHAEIIRTFPKAFLLVEKPLTTNLKKALEITNQKIMVGHTYLYNLTLVNKIKKLGEISQFNFVLHNVDSFGSNVGPLWELAPHPISLFLSFINGLVKINQAKIENGNLKVNMSTSQCSCDISVGWNYDKKERLIRLVGEKGIAEFDGTEANSVSPLENEIKCFVDFIHGGKNTTPLNEGIKVVELLDKIEKVCTMQ